jgi:hypothetical protein
MRTDQGYRPMTTADLARHLADASGVGGGSSPSFSRSTGTSLRPNV